MSYTGPDWPTLPKPTPLNPPDGDKRLRDAAPDLLAALKAMAPMWDNDSPLLDVYEPEIAAARAAIAKAEGKA